MLSPHSLMTARLQLRDETAVRVCSLVAQMESRGQRTVETIGYVE